MVIMQKYRIIWSTIKVSWVRRCSRNVPCFGVRNTLSCDQNTLSFIKVILLVNIQVCSLYTNGKETDNSCFFNTLANNILSPKGGLVLAYAEIPFCHDAAQITPLYVHIIEG